MPVLLTKKRSLRSALLELLGRSSNVSAATLLDYAAKHYRPVSPQAVYKELRALTKLGVTVKARDRYSLSMSWVLGLMEFTDAVERCYMHGAGSVVVLPEPGADERWSFSDLRRLDDFWVQVMLYVIRSTRTHSVQQWVPHPWFHLAQHTKELGFQRSLRALRARVTMLIGGATYLDGAFSRFWPRDVYTYGFDPKFSALAPQRRQLYVTVMGDYTLLLRIDRVTAEQIDALFRSVHSRAALRDEQIRTLVTQKCRATARLVADPRLAARWRHDIAAAMERARRA